MMEYSTCPNCGHDWTAHGHYIESGHKICLEQTEDDETYIHFFVTNEEGEEEEYVILDEGWPDGPMLFQP